MLTVRPTSLSDTFFLADAATRRIPFLNAERFAPDPLRRLAVASRFLTQDRTLFSGVDASGKRRAVLDTRDDLSGQSTWITALYRSPDTTDEELLRLFEGTAERIGGEGRFSVAVTLDESDSLRDVFYQAGFQRRYDQSVSIGSCDGFAESAQGKNARPSFRWRTVREPDRGAFFSFYRQVTRCPLGLTTARSNAQRLFALKDRRDNAKWVGAAVVSETSAALYLEPVFVSENAEEIRLGFDALIGRLGASERKQLILCISERQPAVRAALPNAFSHAVSQSVFMKQLTVPIRRPEPRRVESLAELSAAAAQKFESASIDLIEHKE